MKRIGQMMVWGGWVGLLGWGSLNAAEPELRVVADPSAQWVLLQEKTTEATSIYYDFTQERHMALFDQPLRSEGAMLIQAPDRIRWETTRPYQSILLGAEHSVAQFEKGEDGWVKLKLGFPGLLRRTMSQIVMVQRGDVEALQREYDMSLATGAVAVVTLVPRDETVRTFLASLDVWFEPDFSATREVWMREPGGDATRIVFHRERRGVTFPDRTFDTFRPLELATIRRVLGVAPRDGTPDASP